MIDLDVVSVQVNVRPKGLFINLKRAVVNLQPVFEGPIDASVVQFFTRQFASSGKVGGEPWAPLRPTTLALKRKKGRENMGILRDTNRLWASLTKRTGPETVLITSNERYERGTSNINALRHQKGYTQTHIFGRLRKFPRKVPPRKVVPDTLPKALTNAWESFVVRHIERA